MYGDKPRTAEELFYCVKALFGVEIPYTTVIGGEHNVSPMEYLWKVFSGQWEMSLSWGGRETGKTYLMAMLEVLLGIFEPGQDMVHASGGATRQAEVALNYVDGWAQDPVLRHMISKESVRRASFQNGSSLRLVPGKYASIDGQHPNTLIADEIKHWLVRALVQCFKIPSERNGYPKRFIMGSTNQDAGGGFNYMLDEAPKRDIKIARWTIMETMQPCVVCKALIEQPHGTDETRETSCALWSYCRGERVKHATGWLSLDRVLKDVQALGGPHTPEARTQLFCLEPSTKGLVIFNFVHKHQKEGGNYTNLPYTSNPNLKFFIGFDPSEGSTSAMAFFLYWWNPTYETGFSFQFDELILEDCPDDTFAKQKLYEYLREKQYPDPYRIIVDPHRTDVIYRLKQGTADGEGVNHAFKAIAPPIKEKYGGDDVSIWLNEYRQEVCEGENGLRRLLINPDACPKTIQAIKNWFYGIDPTTGDVRASAKPKEQFKDENDAVRYWLRYKRIRLDKRGGLVDFLEV